MTLEVIYAILLGLYFLGFFIQVWNHLGDFIRPNTINLSKFKSIKEYYRSLILKTVLWPLFLLIKNPFHLLSENIFQSFNDSRVVYGGFGSFQNFYRDIVHGRNRYANFTIGSCHTLAKIDAPFFKDSIPEEDREYWRARPLYLNVIYAAKENQYLLSTICLPYDTKDIFTTSRYVLDRSERYSQEEFFKKLEEIDIDVRDQIKNKLSNLSPNF